MFLFLKILKNLGCENHGHRDLQSSHYQPLAVTLFLSSLILLSIILLSHTPFSSLTPHLSSLAHSPSISISVSPSPTPFLPHTHTLLSHTHPPFGLSLPIIHSPLSLSLSLSLLITHLAFFIPFVQIQCDWGNLNSKFWNSEPKFNPWYLEPQQK